MRLLNQEIDDEIENKNCMLKDQLIDNLNAPEERKLQVTFDTERFFQLQRQKKIQSDCES